MPDPGTGVCNLREQLHGIDEKALDFIKHCLLIDPSLRCSASDLLNHELFDEDFKKELELNMKLWVQDEETYNREMIELMETSGFIQNGDHSPYNSLSP